MMHSKNALFLFFGFLLSISASAQIKLPQLISDGMVLQRNEEIKIWGWASPKESITLNFKNNNYKTIANSKGDWSILLPAQKAGGPYKMKFKGANKIQVNDILFGDVWLCTGQSNMVINMERVKERFPNEIANDNYPQIRNFFIPTKNNLEGPQKDLPNSSWKKAAGKDLLGIGAISYFFAKDLHTKYQVPIGIINASVGGTPIESWISEDGYKNFPKQLVTIQKNKDTEYIASLQPKKNKKTEQPIKDKGLNGPLTWYNEAYVPKGWNNYNVPGFWEDQGLKNLNGVVWFRKEIDVPVHMTGVEANLYMGRIVDADAVYVNGTKVGNITYQYPPRRYKVATGVLKEGKNVVTVRITNYGGKGGFVPDKPYFLEANKNTVALDGKWKYKVGEVFAPKKERGKRRFVAQNQPASLFNAMVAPIRNLKIKGVNWYQGESNSGNPKPYGGYLKALIKDYRSQWNKKDLPFLYVQLANFMDVDYLPTESKWAEMREQQFNALSIPNTAMAVITDLGEWNDIHPLNKQDVGKRLALGAMKLAYGENIVHSGPIFKGSKIEGNQIVLSFNSVGGGLITNDNEPLRRFEIAGDNQQFIWANAKIIGNTVVISHPDILHPKYVKYAWANNPRGANLYNKQALGKSQGVKPTGGNKEGLPASSFRNYNPDTLNNTPWQGKQAAVVLTYDDALNVHLDNAMPLLDSLGLKGTFYVSTYSDAFRNRLKEWKNLSKNGHELANHTVYHPCIKNEERSWVNDNYNMGTYTVKRMVDEIKINNTMLEALDGKKERTFAYTCGDMTIGDGEPFMHLLEGDLVGARGVKSEMHPITEIDIYNTDAYPIVGESGEQMIAMVKEAIAKKALLVFLFHGVGGEHGMDVSLPAHKELLEYLQQNEHTVWTTTMLEAIKNIKVNQKK